MKLVEGDTTTPLVFENQPKVRDDVVRAYDQERDVEVEMGKAKNLKGYWATRTDDVEVKKDAIKIDRTASPSSWKASPSSWKVLSASLTLSPDEQNLLLEMGHAKNVASKFTCKEDGPKERKQPIQLDKDSGPAVVENNPEVREDLTTQYNTDSSEAVLQNQSGRTKDIKSKFTNYEDKWANRQREKIVIDRSSEGGVLENPAC